MGVCSSVTYAFATKPQPYVAKQLADFLGATRASFMIDTGAESPWGLMHETLLRGRPLDYLWRQWNGPHEGISPVERSVELFELWNGDRFTSWNQQGCLFISYDASCEWTSQLHSKYSDVSSTFGYFPGEVSLAVGPTEEFRDNYDGTYTHFGRSAWHVSLFGYGSPTDPPAWEAWYFNLEPVRMLEAKLRQIDPGFVRLWNVSA